MEFERVKPKFNTMRFSGMQLLNLVTVQSDQRPPVLNPQPQPLSVSSVLPHEKAGKRNTMLARLTKNTDAPIRRKPLSRPATRKSSLPVRVQPVTERELTAWLEVRKQEIDQLFVSAVSAFGIDSEQLFGNDLASEAENQFDQELD